MSSAPGQAYGETMSRFYDLDWDAIGLTRADASFYARQAALTQGSICEIGAGTGRVLFRVAQETRRSCVGVEPSEGMRQAFEQRRLEHGRPLCDLTRVVDGSFKRIPVPDGSQGFVYSAFRSFMHVLTEHDQILALREMTRILAPGGLLAFDLFEPDYIHMVDAEPQEMYQAETECGGTLSRLDSRHHMRATQSIYVGMEWVMRDAKGAVTATHEDGYTIRYTFRQELFSLLGVAGLEVVDVYGDFDQSPLDQSIRQLIILARPR